MLRAVRLAATLGFDDRAGDARRDPARSADARRATCPGERIAAELDELLARRPAVGRAPAARGHRPARRDLAGARRPARRRPEQDPGRGPLGPHAPDGRCAPPRAGRSSGWPRCSTTSASPRRWPTATSSATRPSGRSWPTALLDRLHWPAARSASASSTSSATTCSATSRRGRTPRSGGSSRKIGRDAIDDLFAAARGRQRRVRAAGRRRRPRRAPRAGRGASSPRAWRSTGRDLAIDGNDLIARARLAPGPRLGRILDALLERVIADPTLNDAPTPPAPRPRPSLGGGDR